jgi:hypothetical protein
MKLMPDAGRSPKMMESPAEFPDAGERLTVSIRLGHLMIAQI